MNAGGGEQGLSRTLQPAPASPEPSLPLATESSHAPPVSTRSRPRLLSPRSLRAQLALWHGGLLALTLLLLAAFTYVLLRQFLNHSADTALEDYAEKTTKDIAATLYQYETVHPGPSLPHDLEERFIDNTDLQSWGRYVQVVDPRGQMVAHSDALRTYRMPDNPDIRLQALTTGKPVLSDVPTLGLRMVTTPVQMGNRIPYLVQVGAAVEGVEAALQRASAILLILTPSVFLVALLGGWMLVGRSLKPVDEMTRAALTIESKHLNMRLVPPRTDNEIGRLASALNEMIARLDKSFRQIERFSADASHELKTPLTTIRGEAEVALMSDLTPQEVRRTFQSIIEETERLSSIVNNLLLLSRADADQVRLKQEPVALDEVAMAAYEPMERLARRKNITLDIDRMDEVHIHGDSLWLQQLITNLLHNAIHYTPEGGQVVLSLSSEEALPGERESAGTEIPEKEGRSPKAERRTRGETVAASAPQAVLRVRDTGPGIPSEHLPHIFDRFYRVDAGRSRDQGGSGLGLNIAHWIAESHGGHITVTSEVGKGTTFTVHLPLLPLTP
jgi:signal transduction histidine kinase